jgi:hypothetical protein
VVIADVDDVAAMVAGPGADPQRGASRDWVFQGSAHARYRSLLPDIPTDLAFDSGELRAEEIVVQILLAAGMAS